MPQHADILEDDLLKLNVLEWLLKDHTTGNNILWASDYYVDLGDEYKPDKQILPELITGMEEVGKEGHKISKNTIIQPRALKNSKEQTRRTKDKAEVFTPTWVCNAQNNLIDSAWFGRKDVAIFNTEHDDHTWTPTEGKIDFEGTGKTWQDYVSDPRLEITCGEAPYIASRYDVVTGEIMPLSHRVGLLDRKMRVVNENVSKDDPHTWRKMAKQALKSTYGYEWMGDSLLLARETLLVTMIDYYEEKFGTRKVNIGTLRSFSRIISWNLWQMDGLRMVVPNSCMDSPREEEPKESIPEPPMLFAEQELDDCASSCQEPEDENERTSEAEEPKKDYESVKCASCRKGLMTGHIGIKCRIRDWSIKDKPKGWDPNCEQAKWSSKSPWQILEFESLLNKN